MSSSRKSFFRTHRAWLSAIVVLGLLVAFLPTLVRYALVTLRLPVLTIDLSTNLTDRVSALLTNRTVTVETRVEALPHGSLRIKARGLALDWPYTLTARLSCSRWFLEDAGSYELALDGTDWKLKGDFAFSASRGWSATAALAPRAFDLDDPLLADLLRRMPPGCVSNLVASGRLDFSARAEKTKEVPVVSWNAAGRLSSLDAAMSVGQTDVTARRLSLSFGAEGISNRLLPKPVLTHMQSFDAAGFSLTNVYANVFKTDHGFLVTEAGAGLCGGEARLYSVYLNPESLTAGFTLYLDGIDAGAALAHLSGFHGSATGRLHGKLPVYLKNGERLRLGKAFLYSNPGESGNLRLTDAAPLLDNLAAGGVDAASVDNFSKVLGNLDYHVLKIDFTRTESDDLALRLQLNGSATRGETTVPVDFTVTLKGDLEQIINTGLRAARK